MNFAQLRAHLKKEALAPFYVVHGPESLTRVESLTEIKSAAARETPTRDVTELDAADGLDPRKLADDLRTPSLFAPGRIVIVDNAGALLNRSIKPLVDYVGKPSPRNTLILTDAALKPRRKRKDTSDPSEAEAASAQELKALLKRATVVDCPVLTKRDLPAWCMDRAEGYGKKMDPRAAANLVDFLGVSLGQLDGKIQALASYCRERPRITAEDVERIVAGDHVRTLWELLKYIGQRNPKEALPALNRLLEYGDAAAPQILYYLNRDIRAVRTIQRMKKQRLSLAQIAQHLKTEEWKLREPAGMAARLSEREARDLLRALVEADLALKTSQGSDLWIMERLVLRLCGMGA